MTRNEPKKEPKKKKFILKNKKKELQMKFFSQINVNSKHT